MASPMAHAYCATPMTNAYCTTPVPVVPARPTAVHTTSPMTLGDLDMTGITILVAVLALAVRWRVRHT